MAKNNMSLTDITLYAETIPPLLQVRSPLDSLLDDRLRERCNIIRNQKHFTSHTFIFNDMLRKLDNEILLDDLCSLIIQSLAYVRNGMRSYYICKVLNHKKRVILQRRDQSIELDNIFSNIPVYIVELRLATNMLAVIKYIRKYITYTVTKPKDKKKHKASILECIDKSEANEQ